MGQAYLVATAADDPDSGGTHAIDVAPDSIVTWDGKPLRIVNVGRNETTFMSEQGHIVALPNAAFAALVKEGKILGVATEAGPGMSVDAWNLFMQASPRDQKDAVQRHDIIRPYLDGHPPADDETPGRTIRRWVRNWRVAAEGLGCGLVGLLPRYKDCGFRGPRLPEAVTTLMTTYIEERYEDLKQRSVRSVYGDFLIACDDATKKDSAFITPSYQAFRLAVKARRGPRQTRKRKGSRAAYQEEPFYWELGPTTPRHGDHPWQIVHLDHTEVDLELLYENGQNAGKCWLSLATAANPRRFLAVYLSYDPPSYRSCMMLLRILVRRWGRLPQIIVVDGGPEFRSTYFETVLARYEVTKKTRPQARPRHGSVCERLFGTTSTQFIYNLRGNTQIMKLVRQVTKGNNPKNHACWTLEYLYRYLCAYAYEVYDTISHPALGVSPRDAYNAGIMLTGERKHRLVPYDEQFRLLTMPTTPKGTTMVHRSDGVKINSFYYWNEAFRSPLLAKAQAPVRYDPFDVGVAYAYVGGQWVRRISEHYHAFHGRSEREVRTATAALREQARAHGQTFVLTARKLADFLATAQGQEAVFEQRLRDDEQKRVLAIIAGDSEAVTTGIEPKHTVWGWHSGHVVPQLDMLALVVRQASS
jgi:putative transposase